MQFDYIIIGSGSTGSTLAYRLGENKKYSILVLEYGGSHAEIDNFIRQNAESAYHPFRTMRMGNKKDPMTVVDYECKVRFVERLRVADSSIFPSITNGN